MSSGAASSSAAQIRFAFSWTRSAARAIASPPDRERARAVGAPAPRALVGVAVDHLDARRVDPEPVGGDLRVAGVEALAVRGGARSRRSPSRSGARGPSPTRRRPPAGRRPAGRPRATAPGRRPRCRSRGRRRGARPRPRSSSCSARKPSRSSVARASCRACPRSRPSRRRSRAGSRTGTASLADEVLAPDLDRVGADLEREPVHHHLDPVGHLRPSGAADRVGGELVREHAGEVQVDGVERVAAAGDREARARG